MTTTPTPDETLASWHDEARGDPIHNELVNTENVRSLLTALKGAIAERDKLKPQLDAAVECLKLDRTAFYNLIDMLALPHAGWDDASREQIARVDAALAKIKETP